MKSITPRVGTIEVLIYNGKAFQLKTDTIQDIISKEKIIKFN